MENSQNTLNSSPGKSKFRLKLETAIEQYSNVSPTNKLRDRMNKAKLTDNKWKDINPEYIIWSLELEKAEQEKKANQKN